MGEIINFGGDWRLVYSRSLILGCADMPRIGEDFLDAVVYLYPSTHEAQEGINIGGSGFLITMPAESVEGHFNYVVTNRHVLAKADVLRVNTKQGGTHIERVPRETWHPSKTDDLAVRIITPQPTFAYKTVSIDIILTEAKAEKIRLGIGDSVFMVGRFINHEGKQRNAPLVRFGSIAQMPFEPIPYTLEGKPHEQVSIIADIRSIGGYSGSPVFLNEHQFLPRPSGGDKTDKHWLIGIDWGHIPMWSPVCGLDEEPIGHTQVNINSGMAGIIPSWKLLELLMSNDLVSERKKMEALHLAALKSSSGAPDFGGSPVSPPATDENPNAREDFNSLLGAAARKQPQGD